MNTSRKTNKRPRKGTVRKILRLQSSISVFIAIALYTLLTSYFLSPRVLEITDNDLTFISTDTSSSTRPSLQNAIEKAQDSVTLICYSVSDDKIVETLKKAANRNIDVRVIFDPTATPEADYILGNKIKKYPRCARGLMHHKLLSIDRDIVWFGSANMTTTSLLQHGNLTLGLKCAPLAKEVENLADTLIEKRNFSSSPLELVHSPQRFRIYVHPFHGRDSLKDLISRIEGAKKRVFVAMYTFTHLDLMNALKRARERGLDVRVIFDRESARQTSKKAFQFCKKHKIRSAYRTKPGLLHYKTALIDNTLCTGSCNWTKAGFGANDDLIFVIDPLSPSQQSWFSQWWEHVEQQSSFSKGVS